MKFTLKQKAKVKEVDKKIEKLELSDMSTKEVERTVKAFSSEGLQLRADRKKVRYQLYRLRTEAEGRGAADSDKKFIDTFEKQPFFDGWINFASTWDVAFDDPTRIVHRTLSEQEEWDNIVRAKFPTITHDGKVLYPDMKVRDKVDKEAKRREESKK